jgi:hypothetical protein
MEKAIQYLCGITVLCEKMERIYGKAWILTNVPELFKKLHPIKLIENDTKTKNYRI